MATTSFPTYPATTYEQAVNLAIFSSDQIHDVVNGDALTTVTTENGEIPTLRKALVDNFYFKTPIAWSEGTEVTVFNQLYYYASTDEDVSGFYYAPAATSTNSVSMGSSPEGDANFALYTASVNVKPIVYSQGMEITSYGRVYYSSGDYGDVNTYYYVGTELPYTTTGATPEQDQAGIWSSTNTTGIWLKISSKFLADYLASTSGAGTIGTTDNNTVQDCITIIQNDINSAEESISQFKTAGESAGASLVGFMQTGTDAVSRTVQNKLRERVTPQDFGAVADGVTDDTVAIRNAVATGKRIVFPAGDYIVSGEIEVTTAGQIIEFENTGGYAYGEDIGANWSANTRIIAKGTFDARVRTRRTYRASSSDSQDTALSVVLNIQAEGVILINPCIWLYCDYTDTSPTNFGDDCDVGIFVGTRVGTQIHNPQVIGYFRKVGIYFDVSGSSNMPRFNSLAGTSYPTGSVLNGADGTHIWNPYIRGPKVGLGVLGALPENGQTTYAGAYYDEILGEAVTDGRGSFGSSDFACFGGRIYGPDHHSNYRWQDPTLSDGSLNSTSLAAEPEFSPAAVWIDGLSGNASGNLWGLRFYGTRIATFEAFRVRLGAASRVMFTGVHIEGRNGGRMNTSGTVIDTNDYTSNSYGDISGLTRTDRVVWLGSVRQTASDGSFNHYYGSANTLLTDSGRHFLSDYVTTINGDLDLRAVSGSNILMRVGTTSVATIDETGLVLPVASQSIRFSGGEADVRAVSGSGVRLRTGTTTLSLTDSSRHAPGTDNTMSSGMSGARWSVVYAGTATISTSDARYKTDVTEISDVETIVAKNIKNLLRKFKFTDAVDSKGTEDSRWHFGVLAQEVETAFSDQGLDANDYGLFCYDEWEDEYDPEGNLIVAAGNRYGIRYEELLCFMMAAL